MESVESKQEEQFTKILESEGIIQLPNGRYKCRYCNKTFKTKIRAVYHISTKKHALEVRRSHRI